MTTWLKDTFTDTAGVLLTAHTSDSGGSWTACSSGASGALAPKISSLYSGSVAPSAAGVGTYVQATTSNVADSYIGVDVAWDGSAFTAFGIAARYNTAGTTGYLLTYDNGNTSAPVWKFLRNDSGTMTLLASAAATTGFNISSTASTRVGFMVTGTGATVTLNLKINGYQTLTFADTSASRVVAAGLAGLNFNAPAAGGIYFGSITGADNEVQIQVARPTASTTGFRVVKVGTGLDYATLSAFATYMNSLDFTANAEILCAEVYEDQTITGITLSPKNVTDNYYCIIRPVPGYSVNDIDFQGALDYAPAGITLTIGTSSYCLFNNGMYATGFKIHITGSNAGDTAAMSLTKYTQTGGNSKYQSFEKNRFLIDSANPVAFKIGNTQGLGIFRDNLVVFGATSPTAFASNDGSFGYLDRNTFVRRGSTGQIVVNSWYGGSIQDNVFLGMQAAAFGFGPQYTTVANNFSDNSADTGVTGITVNTTANALVNSLANDLRPVSAGPLVGAANNVAVSTNDLRGFNRGPTPDVGCIQLAAAIALPSGAVTSQPSPDGQNLTITFSTTGSPTSSIASLDPASTNPNGAVQIFATVTLGTNTGSATWTNIQPGNYSPTITVTNSGGTVGVTGTSAVSIVGISGSPTATPTATGANATTITISGPSSGVLSQAVTLTIGTDSVLTGTQAETVSFNDAATGTFSPTNVTLTASVTTATISYTPNGALGNRTITASASGTPSLIAGTLAFNATAPATQIDTTVPVMAGSITIGTITNSSIAFSWPAATDNVGVTGYEISMNGGASYSSVGTALTTVQTGLASGTAYQIRVRAFDAVANKAVPLSASASTLATAPTPVQRMVTVTLVDSAGAPRANLSGIKWAFFETTTPDLWTTPVSKGTGATTNALGVMSLSVLTVLPVGATGGLVFTDSTGSATQNPPPKATCAPVVLS